MGVEEELLLVDPQTGRLAAVADRAMLAHERDGSESTLEQELFLQQLETGTEPTADLHDLAAELHRCRRVAGEAAAAAGAALVATATPVLEDEDGDVTPKPRYQRLVDQFGRVGRQAITCGMHVHVDVADEQEAIAVIDRIRPWLPVVLAISANSPYWFGADTDYGSWRSQVWQRWPSAGQVEPFGDPAGYHAALQELLATGVVLDRAALYLDARPAESFPTVELRVADVCTDVDDAVLVAALSRALTQTAAAEWHAGQPLTPWRTELLRAAHWKAARYGISERLVHPLERTPAPARDVIISLLEYVREALEEAGDVALVAESVERLLARGSGAARQRAALEVQGDLRGVVDDLRRRTLPDG